MTNDERRRADFMVGSDAGGVEVGSGFGNTCGVDDGGEFDTQVLLIEGDVGAVDEHGCFELKEA
jgi:hypothetical protein